MSLKLRHYDALQMYCYYYYYYIQYVCIIINQAVLNYAVHYKSVCNVCMYLVINCVSKEDFYCSFPFLQTALLISIRNKQPENNC